MTRLLQELEPAEELPITSPYPGEVYLYNSLKPKKIIPQLQKQLATIYGHLADEKELQVFLPQIQLQRGATDCGCFAVAFALSLLFGGDPSSLLYNQKDMRAHLKECLLAELFTPFLASGKEKKKKEKAEDYWTYRFCLNSPNLYVQTLI